MSNINISNRSSPGYFVISPDDLFRIIQEKSEVAIIDVRDAGSFSSYHLLYCASLPLTRIELLIDRKVPNKNTSVVLVDKDGSLLSEAAEILSRLGYLRISILDGGTDAWQNAGYEVFSGENVPSKAFGEVVEIRAKTPHIDARTLHRKLHAGENLVVVDGRTPEEFYNFSIPGAHSLPNAELPYRIREIAPDPSTLVVVNCAGRTRSIIGAQTLIDAGIPNPVVSLQDGTMAWLIAGHELKHGRRASFPEPSEQNLTQARRHAEALLHKAQVSIIDSDRLEQFRGDQSRTLYLFDIRTQDEFEAGHLPGWRWAPGGQLVQATDEYIATLRARVVIADWDGVRAATVAAWLVQLGQYEVYVYRPENALTLDIGPEYIKVLKDPLSPPSRWIGCDALSEKLLREQAVLVDVDSAKAYVKRHIEGAFFAVAETLAPHVQRLTQNGQSLIITSADGVLADAVARRLTRLGYPSLALLGGNKAWFAASLPTSSGIDKSLVSEETLALGGYDYADVSIRNQKFHEYLAWEVGLVAQLEQKGAENTFQVLGAVSKHDDQTDSTF